MALKGPVPDRKQAGLNVIKSRKLVLCSLHVELLTDESHNNRTRFQLQDA